MENLLTVGQIAKKLSCPIWQVQYLLKSRGIKPICRVGVLRLFPPNIVNVLQRELDAVNKRHSQSEKEKNRCSP